MSSNVDKKNVKKKTTSVICYDNFDPPPLISSSTILGWGIFLFIVAKIWPPLLLVVTLIATKLIPYIFRVNDHGPSRRKMMKQFLRDDPFAKQRMAMFPSNEVTVEESYWSNPQGLLLHTMIMLPKDVPPKAVVCYCHGYVDNPNYTKMNELSYVVKKGGFALLIIEYEGHGKSDGTLGLVKDWEALYTDAHLWFQETLNKSFPGKKAFLMGESMGGAVAYSIIKEYPEMYSGVVFQCPSKFSSKRDVSMKKKRKIDIAD
jgi:pimeloyl-ACP methyl ester carboxylesterase